MKNKIATLFDCIKTLCESDIERIISFVLGIVSANQQPDRPACPHCGHAHVIKYGHTKEKQRFFCHGCRQTFLYSTGTLAYHSHFSRSIWADFIRDTLDGKTLDDSAEGLGFSHQTAFNMRHKVLMAFQDMLEKEPAILSGIAELDETFVLDCYKGKQLPEAHSIAAVSFTNRCSNRIPSALSVYRFRNISSISRFLASSRSRSFSISEASARYLL